MNKFNLYKDIEARTNGEIYIGVVGPVRSGKSTFIKRFMDLAVIPKITDENEKNRTLDEQPQSASGKSIMTTEPKFIPKNAITIETENGASMKMRMIDCVGYMVEGASGHEEEGKERMVKTPWFDYEIPFTKAAEIGTKKVINDHSTIGIVITTDGSFGEIPAENYAEPLDRTINELKNLNKPFLVVVNSEKPYSKEAEDISEKIKNKYGVSTMCLNCKQLKEKDIDEILENILYEFPISEIDFKIPAWIYMLEDTNPLKLNAINYSKSILNECTFLKDIDKVKKMELPENLNECRLLTKELSNGVVSFEMQYNDRCYFDSLSEISGSEIKSEYDLVSKLKEIGELKTDYEKVKNAMYDVKAKGYGIVTPSKEEITLEEPEIIKSGSKYGVKIKANAPSIHFIKTDVLTEIAPIVGTEEQAKDLKEFINQNGKDDSDGIWNTNIFGKTIEEIVEDGIKNKISNLSDNTQERMQTTLQKITNESSRGVICIIV